ncbi:MAG: hypothetical protein IKJ31_06185 [Bacteroidaceae bacterium]|nr:hypothetical protein [Bacteroidaceae bacterium]
MKRLKLTFYVYAMVIFTLIILSLSGVTVFNVQNITPNSRYILEMASVITTIIVVPVAIKGFAHMVIKTGDETTKALQYIKYCHIRLLLLLLANVVNILIYNILYNDSALYCAMICFVALIYCFPKRENQNS